ncbi:MAG: hypothetical protein Q7S96_00650 [bacterium]|nr:hypothetical protein [bacterium]
MHVLILFYDAVMCAVVAVMCAMVYVVVSLVLLLLGAVISSQVEALRGEPRVTQWWSPRALDYSWKHYGHTGVIAITPLLFPLLLIEALITLATPRRAANLP